MAAPETLSHEECRWLIALARRTLESLEPTGARIPDEKTLLPQPPPDNLRAARGAFVTLHESNGELRGCIGYVLPVMPLYRAVIENTVNAARRDPRFPHVRPDETPNLRIEISVMSVPRPIERIDEIEVGRHGLIVERGPARGLLLPQVATEYGWDRDTFLDHTCRKAGLPMSAWRNGDVKIEVFTAQIINESHETTA